MSSKIVETTISENEVLLIGGPAAIRTLEGDIEILGWNPSNNRRVIIVRRGKVIPIETKSHAKINIRTQSNWIKKCKSDEAGTYLWKKHLSKLELTKYKKILILGATDSGKTTFSTFLINSYLRYGKSVEILDSDVGQNDIVPPGYVGLSTIKNPIIDLRDVKPHHLRYYGDIKPSTSPERLIEIIHQLSMKSKSRLIVNTDGYITDEGLEIKKRIIKKIDPDIIISLGTKLSNFGKELVILPRIKGIIKTRMDRKDRRESQYVSFLQEMKNKITMNINNKKVSTYIFGNRLNLKIIRNKKLNYFILEENKIGKIGAYDLIGLFVSLEDFQKEEHIGWIRNIKDERITISTIKPLSSHNIKKLHLGLIKYYREEEILELRRESFSTEEITRFSFNQNGSIE